MKNLLQKIFAPWFTIALTITSIHQIFQKILKINIPIVDSYLDPLLFMPILLHLLLWEKRVVFKRAQNFTFSPFLLMTYFVLLSIVCEYLFPKWNTNFTADIGDVICYGLGTLYFAIFYNKPNVSTE